jgi:galactose-1-phosphate uridylyltransferase
MAGLGEWTEGRQAVTMFLMGGQPLKAGSAHTQWAEAIKDKIASPPDKEEAHQLVRHEVGQVCYEVLRDTGVFKLDEEGRLGLLRFLEKLGMQAAEALFA